MCYSHGFTVRKCKPDFFTQREKQEGHENKINEEFTYTYFSLFEYDKIS